MDILLIKNFFVKYLLIPSIFLVLMLVIWILKMKMPKVKMPTLIAYVILFCIFLGIPGILGFSSNLFSPYCWYILAQFFYFLLGVLHSFLMNNLFKDEDKSVSFIRTVECLITLACLTLGGYIFIHLFDWISPFEGYSLMASTSMLIFIIPQLFYYSYIQFLNIPFDVYKTWKYEIGQYPVAFAGIDYNKLMIVNIEISKNLGDKNLFQIKAKALAKNISFGDWFYKVIHDYNQSNAAAMINLENEQGEPYSWIFYTKKSLFHPRKYIDFDQDIHSNQIFENDTVICKRVAQGGKELEKLEMNFKQS